MEQVFEENERDVGINSNYDAVQDQVNRQLNRFELMEAFYKANKEMVAEMKDIAITVDGGQSGDMTNKSTIQRKDTMASNLDYKPPTAGKRGRKGKSDADQKKEDIEKIKDLMKKIYDGVDENEYTNEDKMLMKMADDDIIFQNTIMKDYIDNPIIVTLKNYLNSRLAFHRPEPQEALLIYDILNAEVKPNGENFGVSLRKIMNACRVILQNKAILFLDDDALSVPEIETLMDDVFNELKKTTVMCIVNDFENL